MPLTRPCYERILLKLSGEALGGKSKQGLDKAVLDDICKEIGGVIELGVQVAIVVGGGNFFRGARADNLTMARARGGRGAEKISRERLSGLPFPGGAFSVEKILLFRSRLSPTGARYEEMAEVPLS